MEDHKEASLVNGSNPSTATENNNQNKQNNQVNQNGSKDNQVEEEEIIL